MAIQAFATVEQLESGWRDLSQAEEAVASELLDRATAQLTALMAAASVPVDPSDEIQAYNLRSCVCSMVRSSMGSGAAEGITSMSQTVGATSASVSWSNPNGEFYIPRFFRQVLGLAASGRYRSVPYATAADE